MWNKQVTIKTTATIEQIWNIWIDVNNWNKWDSEVEFSMLNGNFEVGVTGLLKPKKGPKSKFKILSKEKLKEFTTQSSLPLTKMEFTHKMIFKNNELYITHGVKISGALTYLFSKIIGKKIIKDLPKSLNNLSELAMQLKISQNV